MLASVEVLACEKDAPPEGPITTDPTPKTTATPVVSASITASASTTATAIATATATATTVGLPTASAASASAVASVKPVPTVAHGKGCRCPNQGDDTLKYLPTCSFGAKNYQGYECFPPPVGPLPPPDLASARVGRRRRLRRVGGFSASRA